MLSQKNHPEPPHQCLTMTSSEMKGNCVCAGIMCPVFLLTHLIIPSFPLFLLFRYPADDDLSFEKFKPHKDWIYADTLDTDAGNALSGIMWTRFNLGVIREESNDFLGKIRDTISDQCEAIPDMIGPIPNPLKLACWAGKIVITSLYWLAYWGSAVA